MKNNLLTNSSPLRITPLRFPIFLITFLLLLTFLQHRGLQNVRISREESFPPLPVRGLEIEVSGSAVSFSWQDPPDHDLHSILVIRRTDGRFPLEPGDGEQILLADPGTNRGGEFVSLDELPRAFHYSVFSIDRDGNPSIPSQAALFCDWDGCIQVPDLERLVQIDNPEDAKDTRAWVLDQLWQDGRLPARLPDSVSVTQDDRYPAASFIQALRIQMAHGLDSNAYFLSPTTPKGRLAIYHQGHLGEFHLGAGAINRLLGAGYHVLAFSMPLVGSNTATDIRISSHDDLARLPQPLHYFLEPVAVGLNFALTQHAFDGVAMLGISGGGWATTLYAAIDPRITAAISVAGGYPPFIRDQIPGNDGDFEQRSPPFYRRVSYLDLFVLAAGGRRYVQVFNYFDPCCSQGAYGLSYHEIVTTRAEGLDGQFDIIIDRTHKEHAISEFALEQIMEIFMKLES